MNKRQLSTDDIDEYVSRTRGTPFLKLVLTLVAREPYEETEAMGLGLLGLLEWYDFAMPGYSSVNDGDAGSLHEEAAIAACAFSGVSSDPQWWVNRFRDGPPPEPAMVAYWKDRLASYADVTILSGWTAGSSPS